MNPGNISQMHYKIWEDQNRSIKRTFFWSIIFFTLATVLLLQTPELIRRIGSKELELRKIESQLKAVEEQQVLLSDFQDQLTDVSGYIGKKQWTSILRQLIADIAVANDAEEQQRLADAAIREISVSLEKGMVGPLSSIMAHGDEFPILHQTLAAFIAYTHRWEDEGLGSEWYFSIPRKYLTVEKLEMELLSYLNNISVAVTDEQQKIDRQIVELSKQKEQSTADKEDILGELDDLNDKLQDILPSLLRGFVPIMLLVKIFPFLVMGISFYVFVLALSLTWHFAEYLRTNAELNAAPRESKLSTVWTLIYRKTPGSLVTAACYLGYTVLMLFFHAAGVRLFLTWLDSIGYGRLRLVVIISSIAVWSAAAITVVLILTRLRKTTRG